MKQLFIPFADYRTEASRSAVEIQESGTQLSAGDPFGKGARRSRGKHRSPGKSGNPRSCGWCGERKHGRREHGECGRAGTPSNHEQ